MNMLFNTTYTNNEYTKSANNTLGKQFSLLKKIKLRGNGSSRLMIDNFSAKLKPKNLNTSAINYANIELRPKGIIIHYTNGLDRYSWIVPYFRLVIYNTDILSIHANGNFIIFKKNKNYSNNKKFINKMIDLKNETLNITEYYEG